MLRSRRWYQMRSYTELCKLPLYRDRLEYVFIGGQIGIDTFGADRYLNQAFYTSPEWRSFRHDIIARDLGRELAMEGYELEKGIIIHHLNPITVQDVLERRECLFDPENVVCVSAKTHKMIHFGTKDLLFGCDLVERTPGDTKLW